MRPVTDSSDFIIWDPRRFNTMADHAANVSLDSHDDWDRSDLEALSQARAHNANLWLCVDGARRGSGGFAAGLTLLAYFPDGRRQLLYRSGKLLGKLQSAFASEMLALEWGLQVLIGFLDMWSTNMQVAAGSIVFWDLDRV